MLMNTYQFKELKIEVFNDPIFSVDSADNALNYRHLFYSDDSGYSNDNIHGVRILDNEKIINSCAVISSGGGTGIFSNSTLFIDNGDLLICCGNTVFCLTVPMLSLRWKTIVDIATCFQIFKMDNGNDYIIHGECQITRLSSDGDIKWQFSGMDIFLNPDGQNEFEIRENYIELTDFDGVKYKLDFNGVGIISK